MPTWYVAPDGNDAGRGEQRAPFASLARALAATREPGAAKRIVLRGGRYFGVALTLDAQDSGLTIEAAEGETPVLYGGEPVTGWQDDGDGMLAAPIAPGHDFRALVVDDTLCPRARLPHRGRFIHESVFSVPWLSSSAGGWERQPTEEERTSLIYRAGDLDASLDLRNAEVTVFHKWDDSLTGIAAHDPATHRLTLAPPTHHPPGAWVAEHEYARTYVIWNTREGMAAAGQWYLDRTRGVVVYHPLPGQQDFLAVAPTTDTILHLAGSADAPLRDVTLRGLTFSTASAPLKTSEFGGWATTAALLGEGCDGLTLECVTVENVAGMGVKVRQSTRVSVTGCHLQHCGSAGVLCQKTPNAALCDNHIHHIGSLFPGAIALGGTGSPGAHIARNEIHDTTYTGINCSGSHGALVEHNLIYRAMTELHDGAAIYFIFANEVIVRYNLVCDLHAESAHAYYIDEQSTACVVERNIAIDVPWPAQNHMAHDCTLRENLFISDGPLSVTLPNSRHFTLARNIFCSGGELSITAFADAIDAMPDNLFFSRSGEYRRHVYDTDGYTILRTEPLEEREGTRFADPRFRGLEHDDFTLTDDSPAHAMGLTPVTMDEVGP
ncbi:MAG TPA: right-handed parallel beta-helix repeat-containing protein [Armatimonadota bacterium]|jgi:hypothetical protein